MIYGRWHTEDDPNIVTIVRVGTLDDVKRLDKRRPDKQDKRAVELGTYVVVLENGVERLYSIAYLRADGGLSEISTAIEAVKTKEQP